MVNAYTAGEETSDSSSSSEDREDFSELCAFVKYNKELRREGFAFICAPHCYIVTEYEDGKCKKGYGLLSRRGLCELEYENNEIVSVTKIEVKVGTLRDPTGTFEFNGSIRDDSPMGFGICKDLASSQVIYKGNMIGWERFFYGESMKDGKTVYGGYWCANKRCGFGLVFDENQMVSHEGCWFNDEFVKSGIYTSSELINTLSKWKVNNCVRSQVLNLSGFQALEEISFESQKLMTVGIVNISGLQKLKNIEFKGMSCSMFGYSNPKRSFRIADCPSLEHITIEKYCLTDYAHFELSCLDSLETLKIGSLENDSFNFYGASLTIQGTAF